VDRGGTGSANNVHVKDCRVGRENNQSVTAKECAPDLEAKPPH